MTSLVPEHGEPERCAAPGGLLLGVSARRMAEAIRSLDSRLVCIAVDDRDKPAALLYTFAVAGKSQTFRLPIEGAIDSIADLYPGAAARERELARQLGVVFQPLDAE